MSHNNNQKRSVNDEDDNISTDDHNDNIIIPTTTTNSSNNNNDDIIDNNNNSNDNESQDSQEEERERDELLEDVYSLVFISPMCSSPFVFGGYTILLKMLLYSFLATDLYNKTGGSLESGSNNSDGDNLLVRATQFFLIPVSIAFQEDLLNAYTQISNIKYDDSILEISPAATRRKFILSFVLRFLDGIYSLMVNFVLLLITTEVLSLFLNFAALAFLQSIDDVAFHLAANGYMGDYMEDKTKIVKNSDLPKRRNQFTKSLDSILFLVTYSIMLSCYLYVLLTYDFNF